MNFTPDQIKALGKKRHKYKAKPVRSEDGYFPSTGEYHRWLELKQLEKDGRISKLRRQVRYPLHCEGGAKVTTYTADFVYLEDGTEIVEDFKGHRTETYKVKRNWMEKQYGIVIRETGPK